MLVLKGLVDNTTREYKNCKHTQLTNRTPKYMKQKQIKLKEKTDSRTIIVEDFSISLSTMKNN